MWSSKSLGSSFQHTIFRILVRLRLLSLARVLLYPVSFYYVLRPSIRRRYQAYLHHRFGQFSFWLEIYRTAVAYKNFADVLLDRIIAGCGGHLIVCQNQKTLTLIKDILSEGHGCILISAHFGSWQTGLMGLEILERPIALLQWIDEGDVDRHYFQSDGKKRAISVIDARDGIPAVVNACNILRNNGIVCIMGDRMTSADEDYVEVEFLGGRIHVPAAPWILASLTRAPVVHAFSVRQRGQIQGLEACCIKMPPNIRRHKDTIREAAQAFISHVEKLTQLYPFHFFNFYDMWETCNDKN
ncbi:MAG: lysophospholipid acyltransferase family protein [Desulfovibrionaceae bacterium]|nr:lysophospholipid acyltransferase family protein [Desulfovibrionaceae bacterium]